MMQHTESWLKWANELQVIAQAGLTYASDSYDIERYLRIREIVAEMIASGAGADLSKVKAIFDEEAGYLTPKLDTRAAIYKERKMLLVREVDGLWALPGGWCDAHCTIGENLQKEALEEAGVSILPQRLVALHDMRCHNVAMYAYGVCKVFVLCTWLGGDFRENIETTESAWFGPDELPPLATQKNTSEQIKLCFDAAEGRLEQPVFD